MDKKITENDILECWPDHMSYLVDLLNGEYKIDEAKEDIRSLVDSEYDPRVKRAKEYCEQLRRNKPKGNNAK